MTGPDYYIPAVALAAAFAIRVPTLVRNWRDPLVRSISLVIGLAVATFAFAAPPTIAAVNRATGIANVSGPLVYSLLMAHGAACLMMVLHWRGGPQEVVRRTARRWMAGYAVVIVALNVFFALGDAPVERLRDLDTYYACTPWIREMIVSYLVGSSAAAVVMCVMCWRWSRKVNGWLRWGLVTIVFGYLFNLGFSATKLAAVFARWTGHNADFLSTFVSPPLASIGALISAVGFVLPAAVQRLSTCWKVWASYRRLGPLWRLLRTPHTRGTVTVRIPWWSPADLHLMRRTSDIHDGLLNLAPHLDHDLRARLYSEALARGDDEAQARAVASAGAIAAALRTKADGTHGVPHRTSPTAPFSPLTASELECISQSLCRALALHEGRTERPYQRVP
ncbi:MAB_1171c family putative transporter [Streptomyces sp. NPDC021100]|uniref:MAB_1171c family putative transporter n=1 Tax=Streptomyces sp. NPDC021100 TaxID=3365114 RepID=UPI00378B72D5